MAVLICINAFNLDDGGSTTLWYNGEVINEPSDETGERKIPSVMYI
ncbi:phosphodiester glycosidase family protein [Kluyvera intermedia]|nr:phosphodiester glycosidase family protein [Kluyvera ascorbata]